MSKRHEHKGSRSHLSRREFFCHSCVGGVATAAMLASLNRPALAGELTIKATHGPIFNARLFCTIAKTSRLFMS